MDIHLKSIGFYRSERKESYALPRQPVHDTSSDFSNEPGMILLSEGFNFQQALIGLEGFSHLWVIYLFHHNHHWKPMTLPPRGSPHKLGVFGTRSPYRPNPIGISCLKIKKIDGLKIHVEGADLMDETPILDIKPYIVYSDSITEAKQGWLENIQTQKFELHWSENFLRKLDFLKKQSVILDSTQQNYIHQLQDFVQRQLEFDPCDDRRKRVYLQDDYFILCYRTWRIRFRLRHTTNTTSIDHNVRQVHVEDLFSGYSTAEFSENSDPYADKKLHKEFDSKFHLLFR